MQTVKQHAILSIQPHKYYCSLQPERYFHAVRWSIQIDTQGLHRQTRHRCCQLANNIVFASLMKYQPALPTHYLSLEYGEADVRGNSTILRVDPGSVVLTSTPKANKQPNEMPFLSSLPPVSYWSTVYWHSVSIGPILRRIMVICVQIPSVLVAYPALTR